MISRSQPRPQGFSLKKMGGAGKGKSPGDEVFSLFNLLDFVIYLFIYFLRSRSSKQKRLCTSTYLLHAW